MLGAMRVVVLASALLGASMAVAAAAEAAPTSESIGSWVLSCPGDARAGGCLLRHRTWVLPPSGAGRPAAALEVQGRGAVLVPVVTLRGLTAQAAIGGMLTLKANVAVRFDGGARIELPCGLDTDAIICAPQSPASSGAAAQLPAARSVVVEIQLGLPGVMALPAQDRTLDLQDTRQALARLRAVGVSGEAVPVETGLDWAGFLDRMLRAAGFPNGAADLVPRLTGWTGAGRG